MLEKSQININSLVLFTCFVLLCFSWTNFFYVTPLIIPLSFIFLQPYLSLKISRVQLLTTVFFSYSLFSLSLISVHSLFEFNFYRRDGNIFGNVKITNLVLRLKFMLDQKLESF